MRSCVTGRPKVPQEILLGADVGGNLSEESGAYEYNKLCWFTLERQLRLESLGKMTWYVKWDFRRECFSFVCSEGHGRFRSGRQRLLDGLEPRRGPTLCLPCAVGKVLRSQMVAAS